MTFDGKMSTYKNTNTNTNTNTNINKPNNNSNTSQQNPNNNNNSNNNDNNSNNSSGPNAGNNENKQPEGPWDEENVPTSAEPEKAPSEEQFLLKNNSTIKVQKINYRGEVELMRLSSYNIFNL